MCDCDDELWRKDFSFISYSYRPGIRHSSMSDSEDDSILFKNEPTESDSDDESSSLKNAATMSGHDVKSKDDVRAWVQSVVDYVKKTSANCLDLRDVPVDSFISEVVNIQPILDSLVGSSITKLFLRAKDTLSGKIEAFCEILPKTKLKKLDLGWCDLDTIEVLSLIEVLKDVKTITDLNITRGFYLENDQVTKFSKHVSNSHLRSLNLSSSSILPYKKISVLLQMFPYTHRITSLKLGNVLRIDQDDLPSKNSPTLFSVLMNNLQLTSVTELNLEWNNLNDSSAIVLSSSLVDSNLEKINLRGNCITDSGVDSIVDVLLSSKITHLNLSRNEISGYNCLGKYLKDTKIIHLDISDNPLSNGKMFSGFCDSTIVDLKLGNYSSTVRRAPLPIKDLISSELANLDLTGNELRSEDITTLAYIFCHSNITHISLQNNAFPGEWYSILGESLKGSKLKYINIARTARSDESARGITSFLNETKGSAIASLDLSFNDLSRGIARITSSLAGTSLFELNLTGCSIGSEGIANLAEQLESTAIAALNLDGNDIRDDGAGFLAKYLEYTKIIVLNLTSNGISSHGAKSVAEVLHKTKLQQLYLSHNSIEDNGLESLAENAKNSRITVIRVANNPGKRKLLLDRVLWENRTKILQFAQSTEETALITDNRNVFGFYHDFNDTENDICIDDRVKIYEKVPKE